MMKKAFCPFICWAKKIYLIAYRHRVDYVITCQIFFADFAGKQTRYIEY